MTRIARARGAVLAASAGLAVAWGCGEDKPAVDTSTAQATVKGTVRYKGKAVTKGEVSFNPANYLRKDEVARRAAIGPDGTYAVTTLVGANQVSFAIPAAARDPIMSDLSIQFDAKEGENTQDFELPPPNP